MNYGGALDTRRTRTLSASAYTAASEKAVASRIALLVLARARLWLLTFLAWSAVASANAPCTENLTVDWRFHAAAPLDFAPAVSSRGWVLVGSVDGYVHALSDGGHFEWSYTLDAPPLSLAVGVDGRSYALSKLGLLHILLPSGKHQWGSRLPAGMLPTGPSARNDEGVVFVPSALNLYAFSASAGLSWRAFVGSPIVSGPVVNADGDAWVATRGGQVLRIHSPLQRSGFAIDRELAVSLVYAGKSDVQVLQETPTGARELVSYDPKGRARWRHANVEEVSADGRLLRRRGARGTVWTWIEAGSGRVLDQRSFDLETSAAPARLNEKALVPTSTGRLYVFGPTGDVEWCQIASAPLLEPRVLESTGRIIVSSGDGWVAAVRFRNSTQGDSGP